MAPPFPDGPLLAGRYRLGAPLGTGGMGEVVDAWDTRLGRPVAVKLLRPDLALRPDVRARFEQEARMAARLLHPHVVATFDTGEDDGRPFLVMERLSGRTFAEEIDAGPVDPAVVRAVGLQVLDALAAAHATGMVHRDVKPSNVLAAGPGEWKVGDFGIAKADEGSDASLTSTGLVVGTAAYLSPQRLSGEPATPSSDLYALGVVLYEALAGSRRRSAGVLVPDRPSLASLRPGLPADLVAVVERALASRPDLRFTSAPQMAAALSGSAAPTTMVAPAAATTLLPAATEVFAPLGRPAPPLPPPLGPPAAADGTRRAGLVVAVLALLAVAIVALVLVSQHRGTTTPPTVPASTAPPTAATTPTTAGATTVPDNTVVTTVPETTPPTTTAPTTAAPATAPPTTAAPSTTLPPTTTALTVPVPPTT